LGEIPERDTYVSLLQCTDPPASDALLKAALVQRVITDVQRILRLCEDKQALQNLPQTGSVRDDLWNSLVAAERELEEEIVEVHAKANSFIEGWGHLLFQTASEMLANEKTRGRWTGSGRGDTALRCSLRGRRWWSEDEPAFAAVAWL
jgi:translocation protein SEC66